MSGSRRAGRGCEFSLAGNVSYGGIPDIQVKARMDDEAEIEMSKLGALQQRGRIAAKILAAYDAGCRRFDSAIGGLGGCPFAQDALVGNLPTETLIAVLMECGASLPKLGPLDGLIRLSAEIAASCGTPA